MKNWVKQWFGAAEGVSGETGQGFPWVPLAEAGQLHFLGPDAPDGLQVVFKHSTRCGLSALMLRRFEQVWIAERSGTTFYLLDLIRYRALSEALAERAQLRHQSPQVLFFRGGSLIRSASHGDISGLNPAEFRK